MDLNLPGSQPQCERAQIQLSRSSLLDKKPLHEGIVLLFESRKTEVPTVERLEAFDNSLPGNLTSGTSATLDRSNIQLSNLNNNYLYGIGP